MYVHIYYGKVRRGGLGQLNSLLGQALTTMTNAVVVYVWCDFKHTTDKEIKVKKGKKRVHSSSS